MKKEASTRAGFHHLTQTDRDRMEALLDAGETQKEIAKILGVDQGTISRERKRRRKNGAYSAKTAQQKANVKRANSKYQGMKIEREPKLKERIIRELKQLRSPDEIAGRMKTEGFTPRVRTVAIYQWLYSAHGQQYCRYLCTRRYRKKKQKRAPKRALIPNRVSLKERPKEGIHAEGDLFVSPTKLGTSTSGAILCIPETKLLAGMIIPDRRPETMVGAVTTLTNPLSITDITWDNGIENRYHEQFPVPSYFCEPHAPWQKPHVENSIGLLRRWFLPKGTDLQTVPEEELQGYYAVLNHKWRKSLGYRSAYEVSVERAIIQKIPSRKGEEMERKRVKKT